MISLQDLPLPAPGALLNGGFVLVIVKTVWDMAEKAFRRNGHGFVTRKDLEAVTTALNAIQETDRRRALERLDEQIEERKRMADQASELNEILQRVITSLEQYSTRGRRRP